MCFDRARLVWLASQWYLYLEPISSLYISERSMHPYNSYRSVNPHIRTSPCNPIFLTGTWIPLSLIGSWIHIFMTALGSLYSWSVHGFLYNIGCMITVRLKSRITFLHRVPLGQFFKNDRGGRTLLISAHEMAQMRTFWFYKTRQKLLKWPQMTLKMVFTEPLRKTEENTLLVS